MVYHNRFVVAVMINGEFAKELHNGTVPIPFGCEFSLRLRNKHSRRAVAKIFIDGENVSGGGYIVDANSHVDIERHYETPTKFQFVSLDSAEAIDQGKNGPNYDKLKGVVRVEWYLEKEYKAVFFAKPRPTWHSGGGNILRSRSSEFKGCEGLLERGSNDTFGLVSPQSLSYNSTCECDGGFEEKTSGGISLTSSSFTPELQDGATVQGSHSNQRFATRYIDVEDNFTEVKLFLQGYHPEETNYDFAAQSAPKPVLRPHIRTDAERVRKGCRCRHAVCECGSAPTTGQTLEALEAETQRLAREIELLKRKQELEAELEALRSGK